MDRIVASLSHHVLAHVHHHRHHFVRQHASRQIDRRLRFQLRLVVLREEDLRARVRYGVADDREVDGDAALLRVENRVDEASKRVGREVVVLDADVVELEHRTLHEQQQQAAQVGHRVVVQIAVCVSSHSSTCTVDLKRLQSVAAVVAGELPQEREDQMETVVVEVDVLQNQALQLVHDRRRQRRQVQLQTDVRNVLYRESPSRQPPAISSDLTAFASIFV